jgi:hypothetical protein
LHVLGAALWLQPSAWLLTALCNTKTGETE